MDRCAGDVDSCRYLIVRDASRAGLARPRQVVDPSATGSGTNTPSHSQVALQPAESEPRKHGHVILLIECRVANGRDARAVVRQTFPQSIRLVLERSDALFHGRVVR